jgi:signal transduction histidine kinase/CheY-like chemotaxis protein
MTVTVLWIVVALLLASTTFLALRESLRGRLPAAPKTTPPDIAALQERIEQLERARARAEESNEAKNEYLANVSHEIRTPLGGIIGMTQIALDSELTPEQRACIESAQSSASSLLRVINDILDFSKIEARKLDLQPVHFDLHDRISEVVKSFGVPAHKKGLDLALHILPGVPHNVVGDDGRLRQVMVNLLGNAVKFTDQGEVIVRVEVRARTRQDVLLHVTVRDTGPGVPREKHEAIFERYEQADDTITRKFGGTGLGLSISSRLVELMGGRVWVDSNPDAPGSTFHFTARLWLQRLATVEPRPILPVSVARQRALVVDDHPATRVILGSILTHWGLEPVAADSSEQALRLMHEEDEQGFAVVLIDAALQSGDGFALAETIRRNPRLPGSIVMMLPSPGDFEGAARCRQMGMSSYVTKPVPAGELSDAITRALHAPLPVMHDVAAPAQPLRGSHRLRLLVVEDDPVNRELTAAYLKRWGHRVHVVRNGSEALAALRGSRFDAVLTDVQMPGLSGLELAARVREREEGSGTRLPIVAISARAGQKDRERCLEAGMDDYVAKPIDPGELFSAIERVTPMAPGLERYSGELLEHDLSITADDLLARVDGNNDLARRITAVFLDDTPRSLDTLRQAVLERDSASIASIAHRLKGAVSNFPAEEAMALAARVEIAGRRESLEDIDLAFDRLEEEMHEVMEALRAALAKL